MCLNELEKLLIQKFLEDDGIEIAKRKMDFNLIGVSDRELTGVGFLTQLLNCDELKVTIHYIYPVADTYAYCLMKNHFHLLIRLRPKNLDLTGLQDLSGLTPDYSKSFSNLFNAYTKTINKTYQRTGSLFEKPFKRIQVDSDNYLIQLVSYIHRNPQKHGFTSDFRTYPYSSYQTIHAQKNSRLQHQQVLQWFGNLQIFENYHDYCDEQKIANLIKDDITE